MYINNTKKLNKSGKDILSTGVKNKRIENFIKKLQKYT